VRAGIGTVDLPRALEQIEGDFAQLEGGPSLNAAMFAADLVDEINVTVSASLVGGKGPALATSAIPLMHRYELAHVVTDDGFAFLRYLRAR
jgi:riboflavin biosynthesis pyrimidine reductase